MREWLQRLGVQPLYLESGSPWENGYIESFNGKLRDELLSGINYGGRSSGDCYAGWA